MSDTFMPGDEIFKLSAKDELRERRKTLQKELQRRISRSSKERITILEIRRLIDEYTEIIGDAELLKLVDEATA